MILILKVNLLPAKILEVLIVWYYLLIMILTIMKKIKNNSSLIIDTRGKFELSKNIVRA